MILDFKVTVNKHNVLSGTENVTKNHSFMVAHVKVIVTNRICCQEPKFNKNHFLMLPDFKVLCNVKVIVNEQNLFEWWSQMVLNGYPGLYARYNEGIVTCLPRPKCPGKRAIGTETVHINL